MHVLLIPFLTTLLLLGLLWWTLSSCRYQRNWKHWWSRSRPILCEIQVANRDLEEYLDRGRSAIDQQLESCQICRCIEIDPIDTKWTKGTRSNVGRSTRSAIATSLYRGSERSVSAHATATSTTTTAAATSSSHTAATPTTTWNDISSTRATPSYSTTVPASASPQSSTGSYATAASSSDS